MQKLKSSILLIEDDANLVLILEKFLLSLNYKVDFSYSGKCGTPKALKNKYNLIIVDICLPDTNGIQIIKQIREINNKPIIVITGQDPEEYELESYKNKANIFHKKPLNFDILEAQISSLLPQNTKPRLIRSNPFLIDISKYLFKEHNAIIPMTKTEFDFLVMLFNSKGEIFTREKVISTVMNYYNIESINSVDTMISRIRKKLKNKDLIVTVNKKGYCINNEYLKNRAFLP